MPDFGPRFAGVELYFDDLQRAKEFYRDLLGLEMEEDDPAHHAKFRLKADPSLLTDRDAEHGKHFGDHFLCLEKKGVEDYPSLDKAVLFFEVADLTGFVAKVGQERIVQTGPQSGPPRWAVLHDPEGHNILIIQK